MFITNTAELINTSVAGNWREDIFVYPVYNAGCSIWEQWLSGKQKALLL